MESIIEKNCILAVIKLIKVLNIPVTKTTIKNELIGHPDYPSLLSVSDKLAAWNIENIAMKIDKSQISKMRFPLLVQVKQIVNNKNQKKQGIIDKKAESLFVVVKSISNDKITFSDVENEMKWKTISYLDFENIWTGVVLIVSPLANAGEENYTIALRKELTNKIIIYVVALAVIALLVSTLYKLISLSSIFGFFPLLYYILALFGTGICILLLMYELDKESTIVKKACTIGRQTNCNAILESKASKVAGILSWSEIGFGFFIGELLLIIFSNVNANLLNFFTLLSLISIIYPFFSFYYQKFIAKEWCNICLSIQAIIILQFIISIYYIRSSQIIHVNIDKFNLEYFLYLSFPLFIWLILKSTLITAKNGNKDKVVLSRLKNNSEIFEALLSTQKEALEYDGIGITLGNINGKYKLLKICNPYCNPCARAHPIIENILKTNNDVQVQIIFNASSNLNDNKAKPVRHFLEYAMELNNEKIKEVLNDWYNNSEKNYDLFASNHPLQNNLSDYDLKLDKMSEWCINNKISATPTYFINGRQLPEIYSVEDLKYLLV